MCRKISESKKSTKKNILDTAFSFFYEPRFLDFSMNELATRVGLSKPAIYRYFSNKDALILEMREYFFDLLFERVYSIQNNENKKTAFAKLIKFFAERSEFVNYFLYKMQSEQDFDKISAAAMKSRGIREEDEYLQVLDGKYNDIYEYSVHLYAFFSFFVFIKFRERVINLDIKTTSIDDFSAKLADFIFCGLKNSADKSDVIFPISISAERRAELLKICEISKDLFPSENQIFAAIASCIERFGSNGVTLERVADSLGMAKSSLYYYFDNKSEMLFSLAEKEIAFLEEFVRENSVEARNFSEYIWIVFHSEIEFFLARPSIIPSLGWILQNGSGNLFRKGSAEISNIWEKKMGKFVFRPDLGFAIPSSFLTIWLGSIPAAICVLSKKKSISKEKTILILETIFEFVENGICVKEAI